MSEVWFARAMGLLDDAIREHLEFKRLHGADPGEVARQEHEALGPVYRGEEPAPEEHADIPERPTQPSEEPTPPAQGSHPDTPQELPHGGQETAELDMRTVLKTPPQQISAEDSLEWEVPGGSSPLKRCQDGGHVDIAADDPGEPIEDVLEETPDFLRETPDQERLWFEQQPPRDFDFDK